MTHTTHDTSHLSLNFSSRDIIPQLISHSNWRRVVVLFAPYFFGNQMTVCEFSVNGWFFSLLIKRGTIKKNVLQLKYYKK